MVRLGPELLIYQVAEVHAQLVSALQALLPGEGLALDCAALRDLDGAGTQLLVLLARALQAQDGRLQLLACHDDIRRQLDGCGLAGCFDHATAPVAAEVPA